MILSQNPNTSDGNIVDRIAQTVYSPFAMLAGMQLDLFSVLKHGPMTNEQIANTMGVSPTKLRPLLYALVATELLNVDDGLFTNSEAADRYLVRGNTSCMVDSHELYSILWNAVLKTADTIRTGVPQAKLDYSAMSQNELEQFFRGEHPSCLAYGRELVENFDLVSYHTLLDVGGGSGGLSISVCEACPHIQATVVELPAVAPITQRFINETVFGKRIEVIEADILLDTLPGSYDIGVLSSLIQILSPDNARHAINNISRVINPGGAIWIRGSGIIDDSRISPLEKVGLNLVFINVYDEGQAYTEQEHRDWLTEAGFEDFRRIRLTEGNSIITARKSK